MADQTFSGGRSLEQEIENLHELLDGMSYYKLLRVGRHAEERQIKKVYHRMAQQLHPDRHRATLDAELHEKLETVFNEITTAYNTLSDPERRAAYEEELELLEKEGQAGQSGLSGAELKKAEELYAGGREAYKAKDLRRAVSIFEQLVAMVPNHPEYRAKLALAQMAIPKYRSDALEHVKKAISMNREKPGYHALAGRILLKQKNHDEAEIYFRRALSWDPSSRPSRSGLQEIEDYRESIREDLPAKLKRGLKKFFGMAKEDKKSERPKELRSRLAHQKHRKEEEEEDDE